MVTHLDWGKIGTRTRYTDFSGLCSLHHNTENSRMKNWVSLYLRMEIILWIIYLFLPARIVVIIILLFYNLNSNRVEELTGRRWCWLSQAAGVLK